MFRFFRSIRHKLINENKTVRYLKYAVGEIVLIMVGIFLAIQLNNWNEGRKDRIEEREILTILKSEVKMGIETLPRRIDNVQSKLDSLARVAAVFNGIPVDDHRAFLADIVDASNYGFGHPNLQSTSFEEYRNSGKLSIIQNRILRDNIIDYYKYATSRQVELIESDFSETAYDLIPFEQGTLEDVKKGLPDSEYAVYADRIQESELGSHVTREVNRGELLYRNWTRLEAIGTWLIAEIEAELDKN